MQTPVRMNVLALMVLGLFAVTSNAHMLTLGRCRPVEGMANFSPAKFAGVWYVIKKIVTRSNCLNTNYTLTESGKGFRVQEARRPPYSDIIPVDLAITNTGILEPNGQSASTFKVTWYNGIIPMSGNYIISDTDYTNYAIDYECQEILGFMKRQSATILSRKPNMNDTMVEELQQMLATKYEIPINRLNKIDQENCVKLDANDYNLVIDEEGFKSALQEFQEIRNLTKEATNVPQEE